ncbi:MAG: dTDP-glucose 4,6-dehydratase [Calditrichia bacterium]
MNSILVTGGAGFIGSNFVRYMVNKYPTYKIIVLDALTYAGNRGNLSDLEGKLNYLFIKGNIQDADLVDNVVSNVDTIINFAAETHVDRSILDAASFIKTDILGTHVLLEAAKKYNIKRYIQISTDEVYGSIENGSFSETDPLMPNSPYSSSKAGGDLLVRAYYKTYGVPAIITRSSNNFGPFQYPEKLIPLFITNAIDNKKLPLYGDGKNVRDWLYVIDNCEAIDTVLHQGVPGEIYNIGAGNELTNIEITKKILSLLDKDDSLIEYVKDRPAHDRRYSVNISKISALGWKPAHNFEQAMEETVKWYVENESWWRQIKEKQKEYQQYYQQQYNQK